MGHHGYEAPFDGSQPNEDDNKKREEFFKSIGPIEDRLKFKLGATGRFPEGKLTSTDEGEIRIAIGHTGGKVVIDFGKPTAWIGFTPAQARQIANDILKHAEEI